MKDILTNLKPRLQNYGTWIAFFALVPILAQIFGFQLPANFSDAINTLLTLLVMLGVLNNPSNGVGYKDE